MSPTSRPFHQPTIPLSGSFVNQETHYIHFEDLIGGTWDCWLQGNWAMDISWELFQETEELAVHWACNTSAGKQRSGSSMDSDTLDLGHCTTRKCQGQIECVNPTCAHLVCPNVHGPTHIQKQLQLCCSAHNCGAELIHTPCPNEAQIIHWSGGVHYINGIAEHNHPKLPTLHLTPSEKTKLQQLVIGNPKSAPATLISGNTVNGTTTTDISNVLIHSGRVGYYHSAILGKDTSKAGNDFIASFMEYQRENPDWIISETMLSGGCSLPLWPLSFMMKHFKLLNHSMVLFLMQLMHSGMNAALCWYYSNGATARHFKHHFLVLFESIAGIAQDCGKQVKDELFTNIVNFSEAEWHGFIILSVQDS
ncbi:hypothetical protein GYMLUDRAFT_253197 [Collybiopsis luxurians FD-317 M1]|uniref:Unplaced genomic scaffold GYMLUscaffold_174, whole genome shotgun sequence n=1 Tax=Collybiopsis luxurians FD-317 M1 TaxID=944289 RepID=A0A0D0B7U0_9AGAR|nr:hypothetical protein GYMLUDRAFT_253197 [Collybiopsis luxurians FD-317 M1]